MSLIDEMRDAVADSKIGSEKIYTPTYSTGFDLLDYYNGRYRPDGSVEVGVDAGKIITVIGKSGSGKTTFAIQTAINIINPYPEGFIAHLDYEKGTNINRIMALSGWDKNKIKEKYMLINSGIYAESLYTLVKKLAELKIDKYDKYKYDTGEKDYNGNPIYELQPTVVLVDSWALLASKDITDEKELSGSMSASSIAKTNNAIVKRIVSHMEQANIILIAINHIGQKIEIGFTKTQAQINYLKQDETLPGGSSIIYLANTLIKIVTSTKLDPDEKFGIKGFLCIVELIKSRSNESGKKFTMVFNQSEGFDNLLSNLNMLLENKMLSGSPRAYRIGDCPVTFTLKTFKEKYYDNEELREAFDKAVNEKLLEAIPEVIKTSAEAIANAVVNDSQDFGTAANGVKLIELYDEDYNVYLGEDGKYYDGESGEEVVYED